MTAAERIAWIDIAKGICIVAVVSMYAVERVAEIPGSGNWMEYWVRFARPFRMPDFFLISGLFLSRVIDRPWRQYLDKKAVHYLYFFGLWTLIYFPLLALQGKAGNTSGDAAVYLVQLFYEPFGMLWFIQMLAVYFLMTRLLRDVPAWVVVPLALLWQFFPVKTPLHQFDKIGERFIYFYAGYAFAPFFFQLADWARDRRRAAMACLVIWAGFNGLLVQRGLSAFPGIGAALGFLGAGAVITASSLLSPLPSMRWLSRLGERSIVIYLSFLIPMTAIFIGVDRLGWFVDRGSLAAAVTALSMLASLWLDRLTTGTPLRILFERPRWAMLPEPGARKAAAPEPLLPASE